MCPRAVHQTVARTLAGASTSNALLCQAARRAEKGGRMLPRENKGKGCVVQRVKMPPISKEVRELGWQTGSGAFQLLLCVLLQLLHK